MRSLGEFQIRDMFNEKQKNYNWESFSYIIPKHYAKSNFKSKVGSGNLFGNKQNFLDHLQKLKKHIPGPSHYKNTSMEQKVMSGCFDKSERVTMGTQIKKKSKNVIYPGPASYHHQKPQYLVKKPKNKLKKSQKKQLTKQHYLNGVQYLSNSSPGVGAYYLTKNKHVGVPMFPHKRSKSQQIGQNSDVVDEEKKQQKVQKQNSQALDPYKNYPGTFQSLKKKGKNVKHNFFGLSKRFNGQSPKYQKLIDPNSYKINSVWSDKSNIMNQTCSNFHSKSVYYN